MPVNSLTATGLSKASDACAGGIYRRRQNHTRQRSQTLLGALLQVATCQSPPAGPDRRGGSWTAASATGNAKKPPRRRVAWHRSTRKQFAAQQTRLAGPLTAHAFAATAVIFLLALFPSVPQRGRREAEQVNCRSKQQASPHTAVRTPDDDNCTGTTRSRGRP